MASTVNSRLKQVRSLLNKTQNEFAKELETSQGNLSHIENGDTVPTGTFFTKLAERYPDVNFNWLYYNEGAPLRSQDKDRLPETIRMSKVDHKETEKRAELEKELARLREESTRNAKLIDRLLGEK